MSQPLTGEGLQLPKGAKLIIVRAPADTDPSVFEGMKLSDLEQDDPEVTKQIAIAYFKDEASGFVQASAAKSFCLVDKDNSSDAAPKVVRAERPPMIPPSNLKVSKLPFDTIVPRKEAAKSKKSKKRTPEEASATSVPSSSKKRKQQK